MNILSQLNSPTVYLICGIIVAFVAIICLLFLLRAWYAGKAMGMDVKKMRQVVISSATFSILPSVGILLGVIALSGSLGTPWPWLRLSVIGALHYETQVAQAAAEQSGMTTLSGAEMTASAFVNIALLMSLCIVGGIVLSVFFNRRYTSRLSEQSPKSGGKGFGDSAMTALFVGLVSAYLGSYLGNFISENGLLTFSGSLLPLLVSGVSAAMMALFVFLGKKKKMAWVESFSVAASMLIGMASAVLVAWR